MVSIVKKLSLDSMHKKLEDFHNIFTSLKNRSTQKKRTKKQSFMRR